MDDECQICLEKFMNDNREKYPKRLPCCTHIFCLSCLKDIYKRKDQKIECPLCRKTTSVSPDNLPNEESIFVGMVTCPNCTSLITKNKLFFNFDKKLIKCSKCQQGEMPMDSFLPDFSKDLSKFLSSIPKHTGNLFKFMEEKINQNLDDFFSQVKENIAKQLKKMVYEGIKAKFQYDLLNDVNRFNKNIKKLKELSSTIKNLKKEKENVNIKKFEEQILFYSNNFKNLQMESNIFSLVNNKLKSEPQLVNLCNDIKKDEVEKFLLKIFKAFTSNEKWNGSLTGISVIDSQFNKEKEKLKNGKNFEDLIKGFLQQINQRDKSIKEKDEEIKRLMDLLEEKDEQKEKEKRNSELYETLKL